MAWEQLANDITFYAFFAASKVGKTGLTVTVDVYEVTSGGASTKIVTAGSAAEIGGGLYGYRLAASNVDAVGEYLAILKTTDATVDQKEIPSLWIVGRDGDEYLDAAVSTRSTLTAAQAATAVLSEAVPGAYASGSAGNALGRIASGQLTIVQPVIDDGLIRIKRGDDYYAADGRSFDVTLATWPVLTGATIVWTVAGTACNGSVVNASTVRLELTKVQSAALATGAGAYSIRATLATTAHETTLVEDAIVLVT